MQTSMSLPIKICLLYLTCLTVSCFAEQTSTLIVDAKGSVRKIPDTFFGAFFEEINHAGAGGLWAELVRNRDMQMLNEILTSLSLLKISRSGFEAGGPKPSYLSWNWQIQVNSVLDIRNQIDLLINTC
ncbi:Alpha-L-arabinofuranosidase 2 [Glycine soja]